MIAAISMMRRRPDVTLDHFRRHWLDPHGVMTAELPGVRHYVQSHCIDSPATNALARSLAIDGFPELWFDDYAARHVAYTSKRIAECNVDSEHFVGAVRRLVTEPDVWVGTPRSPKGSAKVFLLATGADDEGWSGRAATRIAALPGLVGYIAHRILELSPRPSKDEIRRMYAGNVCRCTSLDELVSGVRAAAQARRRRLDAK